MKQLSIETRNKAEQLLQEALSIWRQSDQADYLEDIEKDPVFSLLMMALAYQSNEVDGEIERLKTEVLEDFARILTPYEMGHATPATAVVAVGLQDKLQEVTLGENTVFMLGGEHPFLPLLATRVLHADVGSVVRLDGRRWKVTLDFSQPVKDLSHFAFAITGADFRDVTVTLKGQVLPVIKPWQYAELPLAPYFAMDTLTYNQGQVYNPSLLPMDLFARQNTRIFCVDAPAVLPRESGSLELVLEFTGIPDNFRFDKSRLILNPVLLVNAQIHEVTISSATPVARLTGGTPETDEKKLSSRQFLHLLRPLDTQVFGNTELEVRGVAGDRFNAGGLYRLLSSLAARYRSDYYAFQHLKSGSADAVMLRLEEALAHMRAELQSDAFNSITGVYLMPRDHAQIRQKDFSLNIRYLTTAGAALNSLLTQGTAFLAPSGFAPAELKMMSVPVPGTDEVKETSVMGSLLRYQLLTDDRLVTLADMKLFCQKELLMRYGIGGEVLRRIRADKRLQQEKQGCGYEIVVDITLSGNSFVRRNFADKRAMAEILLQKMMEVRSTNIYPLRVNINIIEEDA